MDILCLFSGSPENENDDACPDFPDRATAGFCRELSRTKAISCSTLYRHQQATSQGRRGRGQALALNPKERQVLTELALCFGGQQLSTGLLCWPSNAHLSNRTNISERTLSRILSGLCRQGLIVARESANGKRFPIKNRKGEIVDARGFDLTPLYKRAPDFAEKCQEIEVEAKLCRQLRGDVTAARNAVRDLCAADGAGLLIKIAARLDALPYPLPRCATSLEIAAAAEAFITLADDARDILYAASESSQMTGYACQNGRHSKQDTKFPIEDCKQNRSAATATPLSPEKAPTAQMRLSEKRGAEAFDITNGPLRMPKNQFRRTSTFGEPPAPSLQILSRSGRSNRSRQPARDSCAPADLPSARSTARRSASAPSTPAWSPCSSISVTPTASGRAARRYDHRAAYSSR